MPKFSIILPVRNGGEYVKECVNSIFNQTFTDFNLIVLDNCSTDGTLEWLSALQDQRIIIYPSTVSLGIENNWSRIVGIPKNEFITCIGHDDILFPDYLQVMNELILKFPDASLYHTHFTYIDAGGNLIKTCRQMKEKISGPDFLSSLLSRKIDIMGTGFLVRSKDYDAMGGIPPYPSLLFADFELWFKLADLNFMAVSKEACFSFRLHQSTTGSATDKRMHSAFEFFVNFLLEINHKNKITADVISKNIAGFLLFYCKSLSHRLLRTKPQNRDNITVKGFVNKIQELSRDFDLQIPFRPEKILSIKLAMIIDNNRILRKSFLLFKKIFPKPVINS